VTFHLRGLSREPAFLTWDFTEVDRGARVQLDEALHVLGREVSPPRRLPADQPPKPSCPCVDADQRES